MIEKIEQLINAKQYFAAIPLLRIEFKKRFDFSDELQRNEYNKLAQFQEKVELGVIEEASQKINLNKQSAFNDIFKMYASNTDKRFWDKQIDLNQIHPIIKQKESITTISVSEALSQIIIKKTPKTVLREYDATVCLFAAENIPVEYSSECAFSDKDKLLRVKIGEFLTTKTKNNRNCFLIPTYSNQPNTDPSKIIHALQQVMDTIYTSKLEDIGILISDSNRKNQSEEIQAISFYLILITFLIKIIQNSHEPIQPTFNFIFNNEGARVLFEKTAIKLQKTEKNQPRTIINREDRLNELKKSCLTNDPKYIEQLRSVINVVDENDTNILILGESGVGKSFLANNIHNLSNRNSKKFEEQNCGNLSGINIIQKLWGWKKGSFTDAKYDLEGKVHKAEGGTLFLDEIDRTTVESRNEMLTFIEKKQYQVGGEKETLDADVRLIFGSNKDFGGLIKKGLFEEDFYYRMSERIIRIPPLRDRIDDINLIITATLNKLNSEKGRLISIDKKGREYLKSYSWPGNLRELIQYINQRYKDAFAEGHDNITVENMKDAPFEYFSAVRVDDYENLIEILRKLLIDWDGSQGSFLDEIVAPLLAKLYMDDCYKHMNKTTKWESAMRLLGISGTNYKASTLAKSYKKFPDVVTKLGF